MKAYDLLSFLQQFEYNEINDAEVVLITWCRETDMWQEMKLAKFEFTKRSISNAKSERNIKIEKVLKLTGE